MSSGCGDVLSLTDLQTAKKHQTFEAEVITGKAGGVASGADIDYATNQVTWQVQKTLPAILRDAGFQPASFDFTTGGTLTVNDRDKVVYDAVSMTWYSWAGTLPKVIPAGTDPTADANWVPQTDPNIRTEIEKGFDGVFYTRTNLATVGAGFYPPGAELIITDRGNGHFSVVTGGTPNGLDIIDAGSGNTAVYNIPSSGYVSVKALGGGVTGVDSTAAVVRAHAMSKLVAYAPGQYEVAQDVNNGNVSLVTITDQTGVRIIGSGAVIKDVSVFAAGTSYLVDIFKFVRCKDVFVDVNFDATPLPDLTAPFPEGLGYKGASAIYLEGYCEHVTVDNRMSNVRYGLRQGGYSDPALGGANNIRLRSRCFQVGYPIACYTADNLDLDIDSNIQHRAAYLSGCTNVRGNVALAGFNYAEIAVVLGDSIRTASANDADRRVNSCKNIALNVFDRGSTNSFSNRALCGITQSWKAPNVSHSDIHFHIQMKTNNATRTLAAFRLQGVPGVGWVAGNSFINLKVSGVVDRTDQTLSGSAWADYSIDGIESGETGPYPNSPTFDGIDFSELRIIKGSVTGNISQLLVPNATGVINLKNARQGITLSVQAPNARVILTNAAMAAVNGLSGTNIIYPPLSTAASGYKVADDGTMEQWMLVNFSAGGGAAQSFTFPKAFPTNARAVTITPVGSSSLTATLDSAPTATGCVVRCSATGASLYITATGY